MVDSTTLSGLPPLPPDAIDHDERGLPRQPQAAGEARRWLRWFCAEAGVSEDVTDDATIVVAELVANAAAYGSEPILVRLTSCTGGCLVLDVFDGARVTPLLTWAVDAAFRTPEAASPDDPEDVDGLPVRGRGLPMVRALVTDLDVIGGEPAGKTLRAVFGNGADDGPAPVGAVAEPRPGAPASAVEGVATAV